MNNHGDLCSLSGNTFFANSGQISCEISQGISDGISHRIVYTADMSAVYTADMSAVCTADMSAVYTADISPTGYPWLFVHYFSTIRPLFVNICHYLSTI